MRLSFFACVYRTVENPYTAVKGNSVSNFNANAFTLDVTDFVDDNPGTNPSAFSISQSGGSIRVSYVPEPASVIWVSVAGCAGMMRLRKRERGR